MSTAAELASKYQQKTEIQHILDRPNVYIGSIQATEEEMWVVSASPPSLEKKPLEYIPALYKLFDEGIVNCRDHVIRMRDCPLPDKKLVSYIDVSVDAATGTITMVNDGDGLDVAVHPDTGLWIPEMIFGHLRTSTNYAADETSFVGGQNGLGFKLVLIWSTAGSIETVDHRRKLKYTQEFKNHLGEIAAPVITPVAKTAKPYTKVVFCPDYQRLGCAGGCRADLMALFHKRVLDIGALTDEKIRVSFNGTNTMIKNFHKYIDLYNGVGGSGGAGVVAYEKPNEHWEYAVALSTTAAFEQVSFVNGICTYKGGKHVDYTMGKITREVGKFIEQKKKTKVAPGLIKDQLFLFLKCDIANPTFDSQTKECLNTPVELFGSSFQLSDAFVEKVAKSIMTLVCNVTRAREESKVARTTDGKKGRHVHIEKYTPANWAGTAKSKQCILILCEGDSAKTGILSGLSAADRDIIGIYPLRGKLLNVRGEDAATLGKNKEITELKQILGLENGREYATQADVDKHLNYSRVMILCDADVDGSHIKGLCINLFDSEWSSLLRIPGFLCYMNTPILRATRGSQTLLFYNEGEFLQWKANPQHQLSAWTIKYYKGLGTSTSKEFKEYFADKKFISFEWTADSSQLIDMAFNKKMADIRKQWLEQADINQYVDTSKPTLTYNDFIHKELIKFCSYSCERAIPNAMDGLKTSQRKILYCAFKRNLTSEIKVAQFAGYVSEHSNYHHGEASLCSTIIHMAQDYVGSNNINLLVPAGQFGTRYGKEGCMGDDHASPRYIFTRLAPVTRLVFPKADDAIVRYLEDDGDAVEPEYYMPIIPMILVNGTQGIGMGYSTEVLCYSPRDIIAYLRTRLTTGVVLDAAATWLPYYRGFKGTLTCCGPGRFVAQGLWTPLAAPDTIRITELPVGMATSKMISLLKSLMEPGGAARPAALVKDYRENNTDTVVDITVEFCKDTLAALVAAGAVEKTLKLTAALSTTNMYLFDARQKLRKYETINDILEDYYPVRLAAMERRRQAQLAAWEQEGVVLSNKARYITEVLRGEIDLRHRSGAEITALLTSRRFDPLPTFEYLLSLRMDSVSSDKAQRLLDERDAMAAQIAAMRATSAEQLWLLELDALEASIVAAEETAAVAAPPVAAAALKKKRAAAAVAK
jgi:DNA topoisomerase-2